MGSAFNRDLKLYSDWTNKENEDKFKTIVEKMFTELQTDKGNFHDRMKQREKVGGKMVENKNIGVIFDRLSDSLKTMEDRDFVDKALGLIMMLTEPECGANVCHAIVHHESLIPLLVSNMNKERPCLFIIHNLAVYEAELQDGLTVVTANQEEKIANQFRAYFQEILVELKSILAKNEREEDVKLAATVTLACIGEIPIEPDLLGFMITHLWSAALDDEKEHRNEKCSATAMERAVRHQLKMDTPINIDNGKASEGTGTRQRLIHYTTVSLMGKGALSNIPQERIACIECLWYLCRDESCKDEMAGDKQLVNLLFKINNDPSNRNYEQAAFILVNLRDHLGERKPKHLYLTKSKKSKKVDLEKRFKEKQKLDKGQGDQGASVDPGHVMLSYQSNYRQIMFDIKKKLDEKKIKTWIDVFNMKSYGDIADGMAAGVENCAVFLMGVSEEYQNSGNCEQEAKFAFTLKKTMIPLKLQQDFNPTGWLAFFQGSRLYYDLSGPESEKVCTELVEEIDRLIQAKQTSAEAKGTSTQSDQTGDGKTQVYSSTGNSNAEQPRTTKAQTYIPKKEGHAKPDMLGT